MPLCGLGGVHGVATPIPTENLSYISRSHERSTFSGNSRGPLKSVNGVRLIYGILELLLRYSGCPFISLFRYNGRCFGHGSLSVVSYENDRSARCVVLDKRKPLERCQTCPLLEIINRTTFTAFSSVLALEVA